MSSTVKITATSVSPNEGSVIGNTFITIIGSGFKSVPSVPVVFTTAGNVSSGAANIKVVSDTKITAMSPATSTKDTVTVSVVNGAGVHITAGSFTYDGPEITSVNPAATTIAGKQKITLTGKNLFGVNAVNFDKMGVSPSDITVISDTKIEVINPVGQNPGILNITVIDTQGVSSPASGTSSQFKYVAAPNNGIPFIFDANSPTDTYVQFLGDDSLEGHYYDSSGTKQTLEPHTGYLLSSLVSTTPVIANAPINVPAVLVKSFSGRTYMSLGAEIPGMAAGFIPNANDDTVDSRYQYFEPTVDNSQLNIDLSYIDFTSFSLSLTANNAPHGTNKTQSSHTTQELVSATAGSAKTTDGSELFYTSGTPPTSKFLRVISPQLGASGLYHDFTHYLKTELVGKSVEISGTYVGTVVNKQQQPTGNPLTQAQSYDYTGSIDATGKVTLTPNAGSGNGSAPGVPTVQQGPGVGVAGGNIVISFDDLNKESGVYGCNTPYTVGTGSKTTGIENNIYGQVVGDFLSGLNFGYIGSIVEFNSSKIGDLSSTEWWGGTSKDGAVIDSSTTPGGTGIYFDGAQSNAKNYNSYAGSISKLTAGYGFPFQDRLGKNLMTLNTSIDETAYLKVYVDKQIS
jgi:hypothetical protein